MRFRTGDDAPLFGAVILSVVGPREPLLLVRIFDGVIDFVAEPERGRLRAAFGRTQSAVRIPMDRIVVRIEIVIAVARNDETILTVTMFELVDQAVLDAVV